MADENANGIAYNEDDAEQAAVNGSNVNGNNGNGNSGNNGNNGNGNNGNGKDDDQNDDENAVEKGNSGNNGNNGNNGNGNNGNGKDDDENDDENAADNGNGDNNGNNGNNGNEKDDDEDDDEHGNGGREIGGDDPEAAYFYAIGRQRVRPGEAFRLGGRHVPGNLPPAIGHDGPTAIELRHKGIYLVSYTLLPDNADITVALRLNREEVPGSRYTDRSRLAPLHGQALICVEGGTPARLELVNASHSRTAHVNAGVLTGTVSVSLTIIKL